MSRLIAAALVALTAAAPAGADEFSAAQKAEIESTVRAYLLENPEVIIEAMQVLEQRQQEQAQNADVQMIAANQAALFEDGFSHVSGNPNGDITIVEFLDYRCPYCKRAHESVKALLEADKNVRVVFKEFPILGPESTFASRAAMAAQKQGGALYSAFSDAMMEHKGDLGESVVFDIAAGSGVDIAKLKADMEDPAIAENIRKTYALARSLNISGTPGFVIGDTITRGFVPFEALREQVAEARNKS